MHQNVFGSIFPFRRGAGLRVLGLVGLLLVALGPMGCSGDITNPSPTDVTPEVSADVLLDTAKPEDTTAPEDTTSPPEDTQSTVSVTVGEDFTVELEVDVTTAFQWQYQPVDESVITYVSDYMIAPEGGAAGAGSIHRFVFRGVGAGSETIHFVYVQPWDTESEPAQTKDVQVTVTE